MRYIAHSVSIGDHTYRLNASSNTLAGHSDFKQSIIKGAEAGAVGSTLLQGLFNHHHYVNLGEILGGTALGAAAGAVSASTHEVVVVTPRMPIMLYSY